MPLFGGHEAAVDIICAAVTDVQHAARHLTCDSQIAIVVVEPTVHGQIKGEIIAFADQRAIQIGGEIGASNGAVGDIHRPGKVAAVQQVAIPVIGPEIAGCTGRGVSVEIRCDRQVSDHFDLLFFVADINAHSASHGGGAGACGCIHLGQVSVCDGIKQSQFIIKLRKV